MRVYQAADGQWILLLDDGTKTYYETEAGVRMDEKKQQFIENFRQLVRDYQQIMERADALAGSDAGAWGALYSSIITNDDMPGGIIPADGSTALDAFTTAISNLQSMLTSYAGGIDTNFERVA